MPFESVGGPIVADRGMTPHDRRRGGTMDAMMVSIDRAGRVVIPKDVRDRLALDAGTELELEVEGDTIRIERRRSGRRSLEWIDGRPVFRAVEGHTLTDADVQRLRDADQR
jgi:AbrB family looped-hinge helix DNA binding protein